MGMDVYGKNATTERGEYFRNNVWWWRPLWDYCESVYPACYGIDGHSNSGAGFDEAGALALRAVLLDEIESGRTAEYAHQREVFLNALPDEPCSFCDGLGIVEVKEGWFDYVEGQVTFRDPCNSCKGTKTKRPFDCNYPFSVENVQEFCDFLETCGGFEIC
jgi:hypothetical protein